MRVSQVKVGIANQRPRSEATSKPFFRENALGLDLKAEDDRHKAAVETSRKDAARERDIADQARRQAGGELPKLAQDASVSPVRQSVGAGVGGSLLNAVLQQESGGRHRGKDGQLLKSGAGAQGISQIMPGTGRDPGYGVLPLQNDSEAEHRRFASDYLDAMLGVFKGDRAKALAAYNSGPGRVQQAVRRHGGNWLQSLPRETQNYVPSVLERERQGMEMPEDARATEQARRPEPLAYRGGLSGEIQLNLGLSAEARRLLEGPQAPLVTRIGQARPFGMV
ncbi:lytic transglycosylase domain-containing protein [Azotobacter beijerinckii]|uniref:lytic transglycosylase domain-containing protein n=1 Tax=Azotobacter beijerinckii TaxID=170623 RepID=UPI00295310E4|nr:lytic transglycosylase domain-containing protein [Azotobacter beijerinckii]MDV7213760.1 lytic transglycosylase domain-containing protein [Azotobacter beijerinckii]